MSFTVSRKLLNVFHHSVSDTVLFAVVSGGDSMLGTGLINLLKTDWLYNSPNYIETKVLEK